MYWLGEEKLLVDQKGCNKCYRSELRNTRTRKYFIFNWIDVWMINVNSSALGLLVKQGTTGVLQIILIPQNIFLCSITELRTLPSS